MNDLESNCRIETNAWASMVLRKSIERSRERIVIIALGDGISPSIGNYYKQCKHRL